MAVGLRNTEAGGKTVIWFLGQNWQIVKTERTGSTLLKSQPLLQIILWLDDVKVESYLQLVDDHFWNQITTLNSP